MITFELLAVVQVQLGQVHHAFERIDVACRGRGGGMVRLGERRSRKGRLGCRPFVYEGKELCGGSV